MRVLHCLILYVWERGAPRIARVGVKVRQKNDTGLKISPTDLRVCVTI